MRGRAAAGRRGCRAVGVDTGGTFTDFAALVDGKLVTLKRPSTPRAPERAAVKSPATSFPPSAGPAITASARVSIPFIM